VGIFFACVAVAYAFAGFSNFFLRRPFASDAVFALAAMVTVAAFLISQFTTHMVTMGEVGHVDWRLVPAAILVLFALWILGALALACSTRFDMIPTLAICSAVFLLGLMSDYLFGRPADRGEWWASVLYTITPNWQLFWVADVLETGKTGFPWAYVGKALAYMVCYVGAAMTLAVILFEERELS
jgi:hypothetical protein